MKCFVRLKITSKILSPEEINTSLNIQCDKSWKVGDKRGKSNIIERNNGWILNSGMDEKLDLELHISALLDRLSNSKEKIKSITKHCTVDFSCALYSKELPALYFDKRIINSISELNANFDIDLYLV